MLKKHCGSLRLYVYGRSFLVLLIIYFLPLTHLKSFRVAVSLNRIHHFQSRSVFCLWKKTTQYGSREAKCSYDGVRYESMEANLQCTRQKQPNSC